jgi:flagellar hook-associated protein 3 FlgL
MRLGTKFAMDNGLEGLGDRQRELVRLQSQIATGKRFSTAGEDPLAAAQAERTRAELVRIDSDQRALDLGRHVLSLSDSALGDATDLLQAARDAVVQAGNGAYTDKERSQLAVQIKSLRDQLLGVGNRSDGAGGFLFSGQGSNGAPFVDPGTGVSYVGVSGNQQVGIPPNIIASLDGREWTNIPNGNGVFTTGSAGGNTGGGWIDGGEVSNPSALTGHAYRIDIRDVSGGLVYDVVDTTTNTSLSTGTPFVAGADIIFGGQKVHIAGTPANGDSFTTAPSTPKSMFSVLDDTVRLLQTPQSATPGRLAEGLSRALGEVDSSMSRMLQIRTTVGEQLRRIDTETDTLQTRDTAAQVRLSNLQETDVAQAVSELTKQQTSLEVAMKSYAQVSKLRLFDFL